ncbi:hypothetical protein CRUP_001046 [Coryphaenoides rupestris]|nr:hypothetical protein CRUP_001046 [Coryphaenoides rupestris]
MSISQGVGFPQPEHHSAASKSLTLSHNNMIALKPILRAWLDGRRKARKREKNGQAGHFQAAAGEKRRGRRCRAGERSLEGVLRRAAAATSSGE